MKRIGLKNFRCYTDQTINLKSGINLLIGDNASGKTSILKACRYVLSAFFSGFSDENTKWVSPDIDDFTINEKDGIILPERPIKLSFSCEENMYECIPQQEQNYNPGHDKVYILQKNSKKNHYCPIKNETYKYNPGI